MLAVLAVLSVLATLVVCSIGAVCAAILDFWTKKKEEEEEEARGLVLPWPARDVLEDGRVLVTVPMEDGFKTFLFPGQAGGPSAKLDWSTDEFNAMEVHDYWRELL